MCVNHHTFTLNYYKKFQVTEDAKITKHGQQVYGKKEMTVPGGLSKLLELFCVIPSHSDVSLFSFKRWWVHMINNALILSINIASKRMECINCCFTRLWRVPFQQCCSLDHTHTIHTRSVLTAIFQTNMGFPAAPLDFPAWFNPTLGAA